MRFTLLLSLTAMLASQSLNSLCWAGPTGDARLQEDSVWDTEAIRSAIAGIVRLELRDGELRLYPEPTAEDSEPAVTEVDQPKAEPGDGAEKKPVELNAAGEAALKQMEDRGFPKVTIDRARQMLLLRQQGVNPNVPMIPVAPAPGGVRAIPRGGFRGAIPAGVFPDSMVTHFEAIQAVAGGNRRGSSRSTTSHAVYFHGTIISGRMEMRKGSLLLEFRELVGKHRAISLFEDRNSITRLWMTSDVGHVLIQQCSGGPLVVSATVAGQPHLVSGGSLREVLAMDASFITDQLAPLLDDFGISPLPIEDARNDKSPDGDFRLPGALADAAEGPMAKSAEAFSSLAQFNLMDGRLRLNRFFGNPNLLKEQLAIVEEERRDSIRRAIERLHAADAPQTQIDVLEYLTTDRGPTGLRSLTAPRNSPPVESPVVSVFRRYAERIGVMQIGGIGDNQEFSTTPISASISAGNAAVQIRLNEDAAPRRRLEIRDQPDGETEILLAADSGWLIDIFQSAEGPCHVTAITDGRALQLSGADFVDLYLHHRGVYQELVVPALEQVGINGMILDPFDPDITNAVLMRIRTDLPMVRNAEDLIEKLDDRDFEVRESARRELSANYATLNGLLLRAAEQSGNPAERQARLEEILESGEINMGSQRESILRSLLWDESWLRALRERLPDADRDLIDEWLQSSLANSATAPAG